MGNNSSKKDYSERFPLDDNSSVAVLRKSKSYKELKVVETWSAEYLLDGSSSCELELAKSKHEQELSISIHDRAVLGHSEEDVDFEMNVRVKEDLLLANVTLNGPKACMQQLPERKTPTLQGGVLKSSSFLYGRDAHRMGLIVISRTKRSDEDQDLPYAITVEHYFVAETCSNGVSVVAHIRSDSSDGALSVQLEKPSTQPKRDMLSMFHHFQQHSQTTDSYNNSASYFNGNVIDSYECAKRYGGVALGGGGGGGDLDLDLGSCQNFKVKEWNPVRYKNGWEEFEVFEKIWFNRTRGFNGFLNSGSYSGNRNEWCGRPIYQIWSNHARGLIDYWKDHPFRLPGQITIPPNADPFTFGRFHNLGRSINAPMQSYKPPDMGIIPNPNPSRMVWD